MKKTFDVNLDLKSCTHEKLCAVQQDNIELNCHVTLDNEVVDLTDCSVAIDCARADGQIVRQTDRYTGNPDGKLVINLNRDMTYVCGISKLQVTIEDVKGQVSSAQFKLVLQPKIILNADGTVIIPPELTDEYIQMWKVTNDLGHSLFTESFDDCLHCGSYYVDGYLVAVNSVSNDCNVQFRVALSNGKLEYRLMLDGIFNEWNVIGECSINDITGLREELDAKATIEYVDVADKTLKAEIDTIANDLKAKADKSEIDKISDDLVSHAENKEIHVTDSERENWNSKADKSYVDVADKTLKAEIGAVESGLNLKLEEKADKSVAQMWKLTNDDGTIEREADYNNMLESKFYYTSYPAKNSPFKWEIGGGCLAFDMSASVKAQLTIHDNGNGLAYRVMNGNWKSWKYVATTTTTDKLEAKITELEKRIAQLENK